MLLDIESPLTTSAFPVITTRLSPGTVYDYTVEYSKGSVTMMTDLAARPVQIDVCASGHSLPFHPSCPAFKAAALSMYGTRDWDIWPSDAS